MAKVVEVRPFRLTDVYPHRYRVDYRSVAKDLWKPDESFRFLRSARRYVEHYAYMGYDQRIVDTWRS